MVHICMAKLSVFVKYTKHYSDADEFDIKAPILVSLTCSDGKQRTVHARTRSQWTSEVLAETICHNLPAYYVSSRTYQELLAKSLTIKSSKPLVDQLKP